MREVGTAVGPPFNGVGTVDDGQREVAFELVPDGFIELRICEGLEFAEQSAIAVEI